MLSKLLPHIPAQGGYIEVFGGGAALLLAKPPSRLEVYNDIDGQIINLYRVAKHHPEALAHEIQLMPVSRDYMRHSIQLRDTQALTDLQRAALFLHANKASFGGNGTSFPVSRDPNTRPVISKDSIQHLIHSFAKRMSGVLIENLSYERIFQNYDHLGNFMFLDPPYYLAKPTNYLGWNEDQMTQFASQVAQLKSRWILTVDDSDLNRSLWHDHKIEPIQTRNGCGNHSKVSTRYFGELIIHSHP